MTKILEGFTLEEECTIMIALKTEMLKYKALLEMDDWWFYREKVDTIYRIFNKMGYDRQAADKYINGIEVWMRDEKTGIECGLNSDGDLFLGDNNSGYNLRDTPENRERIINDFCRYTGRQNL